LSDPDYVKFLEYLQNEEAEETQTIDAYLEELENKEKDMKGKFKLIAIDRS
jgi:site-specific recombinase XerD